MSDRYRKKPVVIEARRVTLDNLDEVAGWCGGIASKWNVSGSDVKSDGSQSTTAYKGGGISINTLEGTMVANPGDWIIRGVKGEFYPCKHEIFEATYEPEDSETLSTPQPGYGG